MTHKSFGTLIAIVSRHLNEEILLKMDPNWCYKKEYLLGILPFYHIYGFGMLWVTVLNGGKTVVMRKYEPNIFLKSLSKYKVRYYYYITI